jgi:hypothetical protein
MLPAADHARNARQGRVPDGSGKLIKTCFVPPTSAPYPISVASGDGGSLFRAEERPVRRGIDGLLKVQTRVAAHVATAIDQLMLEGKPCF